MRHDLSGIEGIYPILYAFFDSDERLDENAMRQQIRTCLAHNPQGIAALGLATETTKMTTAERRQVMEWLDRGDIVNGHTPPVMLKLAVEDLRAFYFEAAAGQPQGDSIGSRQLADWFWGETAAAKLLLALCERLIPDEDPAIQMLGHNSVVPREQWTRFGIDDRWWHKR